MFEGAACPDCSPTQADTDAREKVGARQVYLYVVQVLTALLFAIPAGAGVFAHYGLASPGADQGAAMLAIVYGAVLGPVLLVAHAFGWLMVAQRGRSAFLRAVLWTIVFGHTFGVYAGSVLPDSIGQPLIAAGIVVSVAAPVFWLARR